MIYNFELQKDRTVTFKLPNDIPLGFHSLKQTSGIWQGADNYVEYQCD